MISYDTSLASVRAATLRTCGQRSGGGVAPCSQLSQLIPCARGLRGPRRCWSSAWCAATPTGPSLVRYALPRNLRTEQLKCLLHLREARGRLRSVVVCSRRRQLVRVGGERRLPVSRLDLGHRDLPFHRQAEQDPGGRHCCRGVTACAAQSILPGRPVSARRHLCSSPELRPRPQGMAGRRLPRRVAQPNQQRQPAHACRVSSGKPHTGRGGAQQQHTGCVAAHAAAAAAAGATQYRRVSGSSTLAVRWYAGGEKVKSSGPISASRCRACSAADTAPAAAAAAAARALHRRVGSAAASQAPSAAPQA
eukprot:scaffold3871_cov97-Isochrysis_galbana.AAC.4